MTEETHIRFTAPINEFSTERLLQTVDRKYSEGYRKLRLLLSSPGGSVAHGLLIFNYLQGIDMEIVTHNIGTVDSIGVVMFCAGHRRLSVHHARFLLHPVGMNLPNAAVDEDRLLEMTNSLKVDQTNIAGVIASVTGKDVQSVLDDIHDRRTLHPDEADKYGLVTEISSELLKAGADFTAIYESEAQPR